MAKVWKISLAASALVLGSFLGMSANSVAARPTTAPATTATTGRAPEKLTLALVVVDDTRPTEYLFSVGDSVAFKDVNSLEKFIGEMPSGSTLTWSPGCTRMGDEPLLNSPKDMDAFQKFCAEHKVTLVIVPSG